jgi:hypothetical protein
MTVVTATLMTIQSLATITSNNYFVGLFPLYFLSILIPLSIDIISIYIKKNNKSIGMLLNKEQRRIIFSIAISLFFITFYFPWSVNIFKSFFGIDLITFESVLIFEQLLWKFIIPVLMPVSSISAYVGIMIWKKSCGYSKLTDIFRVAVR